MEIENAGAEDIYNISAKRDGLMGFDVVNALFCVCLDFAEKANYKDGFAIQFDALPYIDIADTVARDLAGESGAGVQCGADIVCGIKGVGDFVVERFSYSPGWHDKATTVELERLHGEMAKSYRERAKLYSDSVTAYMLAVHVSSVLKDAVYDPPKNKVDGSAKKSKASQ